MSSQFAQVGREELWEGEERGKKINSPHSPQWLIVNGINLGFFSLEPQGYQQ